MPSDLDILGTYYVRPYARQWINQPRPKGFRRQRKVGACYHNAGSVVLDREDVVYCEGFIRGAQHAWLVDPDGRVIDQTWKYHPDIVYVGVPFRTDFVIRVMIERGEWWGLLQPASPPDPEELRRAVDTDLLARFDAKAHTGRPAWVP